MLLEFIEETQIFYLNLISDNSPWRNDPETTSPPECAGKDDNQSGKVGDVVRTKTKLGNIEGKLMNTSLGTMVTFFLKINISARTFPNFLLWFYYTPFSFKTLFGDYASICRNNLIFSTELQK